MINFFFPELFIISHSPFELLHLSFPEFQVFRIIIAKLHLNHCKASPCVFNLSLFLSSFLPEFFMEALLGGSSRILFILQLFFKISLGVKTRQAILLNKHGVQHMFCLRSSSILHLTFRSAILSTLSFEMALCHFWQFLYVSWFTKFSRVTYLNLSFYLRSRDLFVQSIFCWSCIGLYFTYSLP